MVLDRLLVSGTGSLCVCVRRLERIGMISEANSSGHSNEIPASVPPIYLQQIQIAAGRIPYPIRWRLGGKIQGFRKISKRTSKVPSYNLP